MPVDEPEDWVRFGDYFRRRASKLGYDERRKFQEATGLAANTVAKLYRGERVGQSVLDAAEERVLWKPGSARRVLRGLEPIDDEPTYEEEQLGQESEQTSQGADFVRQLRQLRLRSRDQAAFLDTVLMLVGETRDGV